MTDFTKDGDYYRIKSKFITHKYDITPEDRIFIDKKIKYQIDFLKNNQIIINEDKKISLFDISMSANVRPDKYLAEISNRVDAFKKYCENSAFTLPVFLTMTPDTRFKPCKVVKTKKEGYYILADNKNFTGGHKHYVKECRDDIQKKFTRFLNDQIFKDIKKKYKQRPPHFSSYEPHLDGSLHEHALFFIPPEYEERFKKRFLFYFSFTYKDEEIYNESLGCFEIVKTKTPLICDIKTVFDEGIGGVSAYILKYILKSFRNSQTGELSDEGYWYAKHGLSRFSSSRVLLPLYIWRSIRSPDRSYLDLTKEYRDGNLKISISIKHHSNHLKDFKRSNYNLAQIDHHLYDDDNIYLGYETLYTRSSDNFTIESNCHYSPAPKKIAQVKICKIFPFDVFINNQSFTFDGFNLKASKIPVPYRTSLDLYSYYQSLDIETVNLQHYDYVENELKRRGLLEGNLVSLNDSILRF